MVLYNYTKSERRKKLRQLQSIVKFSYFACCLSYSFGTDFNSYFIPLARSTLQDVASTYNATTFYGERDSVSIQMDQALNAVLTPFGAVVDNLQLKSFTLPKSFTDSIALTQQVRQNTATALNDQKSTIINLQTSVSYYMHDNQCQYLSNSHLHAHIISFYPRLRYKRLYSRWVSINRKLEVLLLKF